jgi:hypothetical protein
VAGWNRAGAAWLNLLVFGLAVLGATWLVHQTEYLLEYGTRASTVLAAGPHRLYMGPLGLALAGSFIGLIVLLLVVLQIAESRRIALEGRLSPRLARLVAAPRPPLSLPHLYLTAGVLTGSQTALYLLQENLESLAARGFLPGLAVLLAPPHLTVLPLHLLAGLLGSFLLWSISGLVQQGRRTVARARALARLANRQAEDGSPAMPVVAHLPARPPSAGPLGLRAPPLHA